MNILGNQGESAAINYLINGGYSIIEKNWRFEHKEIDIVAKKDNILVFVEVKTRSNLNHGKPSDAVNVKKIEFLLYAAERYMEVNDIDLESRFDIIEVIIQDELVQLDHIIDAFSGFSI